MNRENVRLAGLDEVVYLPFRAYHGDGTLVVVEGQRDVSFPIARIFYIQGVTTDALRGDHAHVNCKQVLVCLRGKCDVTCDDGAQKITLTLSAPDRALYIPPTIWAGERFLTRDAILLVFADLLYEETDYIRDYSEFQRFRGGQR